MSLALYSSKSKEAQKLKANGFEISMDDDNTQINIIREDDEEVKFNNIYNKAEIDARILSNNLNNLEGFPDITIYPGGSIPVVQNDGSTQNKYATNIRKLYSELTVVISGCKSCQASLHYIMIIDSLNNHKTHLIEFTSHFQLALNSIKLLL